MNKKFIISQLLLIPYILTAASSSSPSLALSKLLFFQPSSTSLLKPQETHREFAMTNFPSEDPCIIVGCKTNNNNEPTAIKTAVAIREFVAGSLILHARSGNHANLELVHKLFLQSFTDSQLLQARISKPGSIIHEQVESFSKKHNIKLLAELAQNKESKEKAFELAKNVSEKDDFVKCKLFWFSCGPTGDRLNLFQFGFPYKDRYNDEDYPVCGVQKIRMKFFPAIVHTLGLSKSKRTKLKEKKQQKQLAHTLDKYKLALAAHQFTNEI
jgi:hypothetical protein